VDLETSGCKSVEECQEAVDPTWEVLLRGVAELVPSVVGGVCDLAVDHKVEESVEGVDYQVVALVGEVVQAVVVDLHQILHQNMVVLAWGLVIILLMSG